MAHPEEAEDTPQQRAIRAVVETGPFRDALLRIFKNADVENKAGLGLDEVEEWLIDDAADFLEDTDEDSLSDFVEETIGTMIATAMPDQLKKGKAAADATKATLEKLIEPVTALYIKAFSLTK